MNARSADRAGRWEDRGHASDYLVKTSVHCNCCGRMIIRRAWVRDGRVFCEPGCERLYVDYWQPRYRGAPG
jgi:hypothetical protein